MLQDQGNDHDQINSPGGQAAPPGRGMRRMEVYPNTEGKWFKLEGAGVRGGGLLTGKEICLQHLFCSFIFNVILASRPVNTPAFPFPGGARGA